MRWGGGELLYTIMNTDIYVCYFKNMNFKIWAQNNKMRRLLTLGFLKIKNFSSKIK